MDHTTRRRVGGRGAIMIKVAKPNQDMRFDVPVIGVETISIGGEARIRVIALEAGRTLLLEKDEVILAAQRARVRCSAASYKSCQVHWLRRNRRAISWKSFSMDFGGPACSIRCTKNRPILSCRGSYDSSHSALHSKEHVDRGLSSSWHFGVWLGAFGKFSPFFPPPKYYKRAYGMLQFPDNDPRAPHASSSWRHTYRNRCCGGACRNFFAAIFEVNAICLRYIDASKEAVAAVHGVQDRMEGLRNLAFTDLPRQPT